MNALQTDRFGPYNALVIKRQKLYLKYDRRAKYDTTRYLVSMIRQNILTQVNVTVLEEELVKLTIRVENLEQKDLMYRFLRKPHLSTNQRSCIKCCIKYVALFLMWMIPTQVSKA